MVEQLTNHPGVSTWNGEAFPYLDVELYITATNEVAFRVPLKPNQQLKYLKRGSSHTTSCFKAILHRKHLTNERQPIRIKHEG